MRLCTTKIKDYHQSADDKAYRSMGRDRARTNLRNVLDFTSFNYARALQPLLLSLHLCGFAEVRTLVGFAMVWFGHDLSILIWGQSLTNAKNRIWYVPGQPAVIKRYSLLREQNPLKIAWSKIVRVGCYAAWGIQHNRPSRLQPHQATFQSHVRASWGNGDCHVVHKIVNKAFQTRRADDCPGASIRLEISLMNRFATYLKELDIAVIFMPRSMLKRL